MIDELALIDSNILSYVFDETDPKKIRFVMTLWQIAGKESRDFFRFCSEPFRVLCCCNKKDIKSHSCINSKQILVELIIDFQGWHGHYL